MVKGSSISARNELKVLPRLHTVCTVRMSSLVLHLPRSLVPMSREEYERNRNTIRCVVDPETGRSRLIRGEGEVLDEIGADAKKSTRCLLA